MIIGKIMTCIVCGKKQAPPGYNVCESCALDNFYEERDHKDSDSKKVRIIKDEMDHLRNSREKQIRFWIILISISIMCFGTLFGWFFVKMIQKLGVI